MIPRYKRPVGWRGESHRHYLASKGIHTRRYNYTPVYAVGDMSLIGADALGTAGASAVSMIPIVVPVLLAYGTAKIAKKKGYFATREELLKMMVENSNRQEKEAAEERERQRIVDEENWKRWQERWDREDRGGATYDSVEEIVRPTEKSRSDFLRELIAESTSLQSKQASGVPLSENEKERMLSVTKTLKNRKFFAEKFYAKQSLKESWHSGDADIKEDNRAYIKKLVKEGFGEKFFVDTDTKRVLGGWSAKKGLRTRLIDADLLKKDDYYAKKVDLKRYAGTWRQVSVKPNEPWFQKGCSKVTAKYAVQADGTVKVTNSCDGRKISGRAVPVSKDNRNLKVDFGFPFPPGSYRIVKLNDDYTKATVRGGKYTWELERVR